MLTLANAKAYILATGGQLTKNFHLREFKCKDGTVVPEKYFPNVIELAFQLQVIRDTVSYKLKRNSPLHINSGYRTPAYNARLDGAASQSMHLVAGAADITSPYLSPKQLADHTEELIKLGLINIGGIGRYAGFTHVDIRQKFARWGKN